MKIVVRRLLHTFALVSVALAGFSANSACVFWTYQKSEPDSVKQLRKF